MVLRTVHAEPTASHSMLLFSLGQRLRRSSSTVRHHSFRFWQIAELQPRSDRLGFSKHDCPPTGTLRHRSEVFQRRRCLKKRRILTFKGWYYGVLAPQTISAPLAFDSTNYAMLSNRKPRNNELAESVLVGHLVSACLN